jgi:hypothetical protein
MDEDDRIEPSSMVDAMVKRSPVGVRRHDEQARQCGHRYHQPADTHHCAFARSHPRSRAIPQTAAAT